MKALKKGNYLVAEYIVAGPAVATAEEGYSTCGILVDNEMLGLRTAPPRDKPPTPIAASRPPITEMPCWSRCEYTSLHVFPLPTKTLVLFPFNITLLICLRFTSIPPSMLEAPANVECPPPLTTNGHCVRRETAMTEATKAVEVASTRHAGIRSFC